MSENAITATLNQFNIGTTRDIMTSIPTSTSLPADIQVYIRTIPVILGPLDEVGIDAEASMLIASFPTLTQLDSFTVNLNILEAYNLRYTEKQVRGIDANFPDYSRGRKLAMFGPGISIPRGLRYLLSKSYSGDVSGQIGESLFVYFLVERINVDRYLIGHLRPEKNIGYLTSDYVIWDQNNMRGLLGVSHPIPVYAEVKSSTGVMTENRVSHGLSQLKETIGNQLKYGMLVLVSKNQQVQGYNMHIAIVRG